MSVRHPGVRWFETMPGTEMNGRIRRRYADGVSPIRRLKRTLKLPRLEKPTSMQTSVTSALPSEQMFGELESRRLSKLMRRQAEYRLELPNEMEGRDLHVARELVDRQRRLTYVEQQVAGATEAAESFVPQEHDQ